MNSYGRLLPTKIFTVCSFIENVCRPLLMLSLACHLQPCGLQWDCGKEPLAFEKTEEEEHPQGEPASRGQGLTTSVTEQIMEQKSREEREWERVCGTARQGS
jgi:hypothetical protein